jgi:hypothetical protein
MTARPATVVFDNEAVAALADVHHPKHVAVLAMVEVTNQRRSRNQRLQVVVPTAVRVEAGWDRTDPAAANLNRISRAVDIIPDALPISAGDDRHLRRRRPHPTRRPPRRHRRHRRRLTPGLPPPTLRWFGERVGQAHEVRSGRNCLRSTWPS